MAPDNLTLKHRNRLIIGQVRAQPGIDRFAPDAASNSADVAAATSMFMAPATQAQVKLEMPATTRRLDASSRLRVRMDGRGLAELVGWDTGKLTADVAEPWVILRRPDVKPPPIRRAMPVEDKVRGSCHFGDDGRIRLDAHARWRMSVSPGEEVVVVLLPSKSAVALCNPAVIFQAHPLPLLEDSNVA